MIGRYVGCVILYVGFYYLCACCPGAMWDVEPSTWALTSFMHATRALCGLLCPLCGLLQPVCVPFRRRVGCFILYVGCFILYVGCYSLYMGFH